MALKPPAWKVPLKQFGDSVKTLLVEAGQPDSFSCQVPGPRPWGFGLSGIHLHRGEKPQVAHELQFFCTSKGRRVRMAVLGDGQGSHQECMGAGSGLWSSSALCIFLPQKALQITTMPACQGLVFVEEVCWGLLSLALLASSP